MTCTAIVQQRGAWWIGWIAEVPGVNCQARTRADLLDDLCSGLEEALEMNRADALGAVEGTTHEEVPINHRVTPSASPRRPHTRSEPRNPRAA